MKPFKSIQGRLWLSFLGIIALLLIQGMVAFWNIQSISDIHTKTDARRAHLNHMALRLASTRLLVFKILGTLHPVEMDRFKARFEAEKAYLEKALKGVGIDPQVIANNFDAYTEIIALHYNFSIRDARQKIDQDSKWQHDLLVNRLQALSGVAQKNSEAKIKSHYQRSIHFTLGLLATALAIAMLLGIVLSKSLIDRQQAQKELLDSESRYRRLTENSPDMIYRMSLPDGRYEYVSPASEEICGYPPQAWYDDQFLLQKLIHPDWRPYVSRQWAKLINGDMPPTYDCQIVHRDGRIREINQRNVAVRDEAGRVIALEGIVTDITGLKQMEEELRQAHKMEAVGTLAGGIAHDFNNILGIIVGNAELAIFDIPRGNPALANLEGIKAASLRAKDMVGQLLAFSRKSPVERRPVNIVPVIEEAMQFVRASTPATIDIQVDLPADTATIEADPTQIQQIVINLCANASQAMEDSGGTLRVSLQQTDGRKNPDDIANSDPAPAYVRLKISDTGPGVPQDIQTKIFDPYFTTKAVGKGSGMGLSIVHGIVLSHGGEIFLASATGMGAAFTILLPSCTQTASKADPSIRPTAGGDESILVVDDEPALADIIHRMLARLGYTVDSCRDPAEALADFKANPFRYDLVISDMTMPKIAGDELARHLIAIRPDIPILICTGFSERLSRQKADEIGIRGILMKPVVKSDMAEMVRNVLDTPRAAT